VGQGKNTFISRKRALVVGHSPGMTLQGMMGTPLSMNERPVANYAAQYIKSEKTGGTQETGKMSMKVEEHVGKRKHLVSSESDRWEPVGKRTVVLGEEIRETKPGGTSDPREILRE